MSAGSSSWAMVVFLGVLLFGCARHRGDRIGAVPSENGHGGDLGRLSYEVKVDEALTRIEVRLCAEGNRLVHLDPPSFAAEELIRGARVESAGRAYPVTANGVALSTGGCLYYTVLVPDHWSDATSVQRVGRDLLASPDAWLWVPTPRPARTPILVHFDLPEGIHAVVPWLDSGSDFLASPTAFSWKSAAAFSHALPEVIRLPEGTLRWAELGETRTLHPDAVREWIVRGARTSCQLYPQLPVPRALVIGVPRDRPGASFGMALRGGGPAIAVFYDARSDARSLSDDWASTHEFLHLGVPRLPPEDAWLFEGLATYYTELTRARAAIITPEEAYQHLVQGFERGRRAGGEHTLRDESAHLRERHAFQRVYWTGAAIALLVDVSARRARGPTLDDALREFAACCANSEDEWTATRVIAHLDQTLRAPRFAEQAQRWLDTAEFPAVDEALGALHDPALRQAIMGRVFD